MIYDIYIDRYIHICKFLCIFIGRSWAISGPESPFESCLGSEEADLAPQPAPPSSGPAVPEVGALLAELRGWLAGPSERGGAVL